MEALLGEPKPTYTRELRSVLDTIYFVRTFTVNLAEIIGPLVNLMKMETAKAVAQRWNAEHDADFAEVKRLLTNAPVLHFSNFSKGFAIQVDASSGGLGSMLTQEKGGKFAIVA